MAKIEDVEDLKHTFSPKPGMGDKLPNPKDVSDKSSFYLKSGATYIKHRMVNGSWYIEKINGDNQVTLEKV